MCLQLTVSEIHAALKRENARAKQLTSIQVMMRAFAPYPMAYDRLVRCYYLRDYVRCHCARYMVHGAWFYAVRRALFIAHCALRTVRSSSLLVVFGGLFIVCSSCVRCRLLPFALALNFGWWFDFVRAACS